MNNNIKLEKGTVSLPKVGKVKVKQHRNIPENYRLKSATVSQSASGKYYVSILFEYENQVQKTEPQSFLGLDFSMHGLYVDSNGNCPEIPKYYRLSEKKLKKEQRKLSKMEKGSKNREKQRIRVAKLHEKVANQRKGTSKNHPKINQLDLLFPTRNMLFRLPSIGGLNSINSIILFSIFVKRVHSPICTNL